MPFAIPTVSLRDFISGTIRQRDTFVSIVGQALQDVGFFAVVDHGIDEALTREAYAMARTFFSLPEAIKATYEVPGLFGQRGYTSFGREHAKDHSAPDLKEFWHIGQEAAPGTSKELDYPENVWPGELPEFRHTMLELYRKIEHCALALLDACALYADEPQSLFSDMARGGNSILRVIHYPPVPADVQPGSMRAAPHEDINLITLLCEATDAGLELLRRDGTWEPIFATKGAIIVDAGDMLQNVTNGLYRSTTHRVVNPDNSRQERFSMPLFVHPRPEVNLTPRPSAVRKTGGKQLFPPHTADSYLKQRLREIGLSM